jgi:hypothetical protein
MTSCSLLDLLRLIFSVEGECDLRFLIEMGNSEVKWSLGTPRRSLDDNIEINCKEIEWDGVD